MDQLYAANKSLRLSVLTHDWYESDREEKHKRGREKESQQEWVRDEVIRCEEELHPLYSWQILPDNGKG